MTRSLPRGLRNKPTTSLLAYPHDRTSTIWGGFNAGGWACARKTMRRLRMRVKRKPRVRTCRWYVGWFADAYCLLLSHLTNLCLNFCTCCSLNVRPIMLIQNFTLGKSSSILILSCHDEVLCNQTYNGQKPKPSFYTSSRRTNTSIQSRYPLQS